LRVENDLEEILKREFYRVERYVYSFSLAAIYLGDTKMLPLILSTVRPTDIVVVDESQNYVYIIFSHTEFKDAFKASQNTMLRCFNSLFIAVVEPKEGDDSNSLIKKVLLILEYIKDNGEPTVEDQDVFNRNYP
jgi:hypothetical protein